MAEIDINEINASVKEGEALVFSEDKKYRDFIISLGERITRDENVRIVLLAGPSGSGKTTTANMLCDAVKDMGHTASVISLDDFYRDASDPTYPLLDSGERDFESPMALDVQAIEGALLSASSGEEFEIPRYDFKEGRRAGCVKYEKISHGCLIIEGLHALNPMISEHLPKDKLLKMFISVSTNVNKNGERILSGRKIRFARRLVRDSIYRGAGAEYTLKIWENVLCGEDKYLYPYRHLADVTYDTFHRYEIGLMRPFVIRLISDELIQRSPYAKTVLEAALLSDTLPDSLVPEDSLMREFIPGGKYEELYGEPDI